MFNQILLSIFFTFKLCSFASLSSVFIHVPTKPSAFMPLQNNFLSKNARGGIPKSVRMNEGKNGEEKTEGSIVEKITATSFAIAIILGSGMNAAIADTPASTTAKYDGFADYAKENQMEKSDVSCFATKCGD